MYALLSVIKESKQVEQGDTIIKEDDVCVGSLASTENESHRHGNTTLKMLLFVTEYV